MPRPFCSELGGKTATTRNSHDLFLWLLHFKGVVRHFGEKAFMLSGGELDEEIDTTLMSSLNTQLALLSTKTVNGETASLASVIFKLFMDPYSDIRDNDILQKCKSH